MKVLHCEDDEELRVEIKTLLKTMPEVNSITEAEHGKEAIKLLKKDHFDLVISDIGMPEMDGIELLEVIKKKWPDIPVLMHSFSVVEKKGLRCMMLGASGFVSKAEPKSELKKAIYMVMEGEKYIPQELKFMKAKFENIGKENQPKTKS